MTGPLEKISIICHTCDGSGKVVEKTWPKREEVLVVCPECVGLGFVNATKFKHPPQIKFG